MGRRVAEEENSEEGQGWEATPVTAASDGSRESGTMTCGLQRPVNVQCRIKDWQCEVRRCPSTWLRSQPKCAPVERHQLAHAWQVDAC